MKLIFILFVVLVGTNVAFAEKYLLWSEDQKLSWDDFQGEKPKYQSNMTNSDGSLIATVYPKLVGYNFTRMQSSICQVQINSVEIKGVFDRNSSWVNDDQKDNQLLAYAQKKFDIAEIDARYITSNFLFSIIECPNGFYDESQIHNKIRLIFSDLSNQEMLDTYNSEIQKTTSQEQWDQKFYSLLSNYSTPVFHEEKAPLVQVKSGKDVVCTSGWILLKSHSDKSICVTPAVSKILETRGWVLDDTKK